MFRYQAYRLRLNVESYSQRYFRKYDVFTMF